jgi:hypothetical protein
LQLPGQESYCSPHEQVVANSQTESALQIPVL